MQGSNQRGCPEGTEWKEEETRVCEELTASLPFRSILASALWGETVMLSHFSERKWGPKV